MAVSMLHFICYALISISIVAGTCLFGLILYIFYLREKYHHIPGPKPTSFFLGNLPDLSKVACFANYLEQMHQEYGPIYVFYALHKAIVICSDATAIKELLTRSKYPKSPDQYRPFNAVFGARSLGRGLVSEMDHEIWAKKRALFNPAFHRKYLMGLMDQFNSSTDQLIDHLTQYADGKTEVKMMEEFGRLTLDVIAKVGFGLEENVITNPNQPLCRLVPKLTEAMDLMYKKPLFEWSPLPSHMKVRREARADVYKLREIGRMCIEARIAALNRGEEVPKDILTYILEASNNLKDSGFGMEDMLDQFCTFFAAGQETTAQLLSFTLLHLGMHPEITAKLKEEVDSILGDKNFVEYSDVTKMQYLTLVLKESLRLNPPVSIANRKLPCDTELSGYIVPKGTTIVMSMFTMGRHEDHFKDPHKFDPERFTRDEDKPLFAYFPFSLGARNCIGQVFAMIEAKVIMSKLLRKFDFRLVPGQTVEFVEALTMKPKDKCKNFISLR